MAPRESLEEMLTVHTGREPGAYRVTLESFWGAPSMGDLMARLVLAADAAGETAPLSSLHAVFASGLAAEQPLDVRIARRGVAVGFDVTHAGKPVVSALARFDRTTGLSYDTPSPRAAPDPETLPSTRDSARTEGWPEEYARGPFEHRRVGPRVDAAGTNEPIVMWIRPRMPLPSRSAWHTAALVFASEFYSHWAFEWRLGTGVDYDAHGLIDHSVRLHGAPRFDDWVLVVAQSSRAANGIAVARREMYARSGELLGTVVHSARVRMAT